MRDSQPQRRRWRAWDAEALRAARRVARRERRACGVGPSGQVDAARKGARDVAGDVAGRAQALAAAKEDADQLLMMELQNFIMIILRR